MSDPFKPIACDVYPIKNGWKILRGGVRIGLASSLQTALAKISKISASSGALYQIRIFKKDGSLDTETNRYSANKSAAAETEIRAPAFSDAIAEESAKAVDAASFKTHASNADTGVSLRERIALLAYSYWERRGFKGGSPEEDWLRAEHEILKQL